MKKLHNCFAALALVLFSACEGPEGPVGPKGKDGNANVKVIAGYVDPQEWTLSTSGFYFTEINNAYITQNIVDYGSVFVYYSVNNTDWLLLPFTTIVDANNFYVMDALYFVGKVQIRYRHSNPTLTVSPSTRRYFKIVTVESTTFGKETIQEINWSNFDEVKQLLNLQE